jgi:Asp-tRNA(Asn)/Glu-tRNA(Gln) amidotransferase A subunit family amidase
MNLELGGFSRLVYVPRQPKISPMRYFQNLCFIVLGLTTIVPASGQTNHQSINRENAEAAQELLGLHFSNDKLDMLLPALREQLDRYEMLRKFPLSNGVPPSMMFNPIPVGMKFPTARRKFKLSPPGKVNLPANPDDLAFYPVGELAALIKSRQITSEKLTRFYLDRLKRYGPKLECVVTITEELAMQQARQADTEIAAGHYRGPLHGIPYGAKDLLAVKGLPTTWGAAPYTNQVFSADATVIQRLNAAGAVLIAKTTLGELAMGETWFGGKTRNPWKTSEGSSGSSAGSAAGVAAGLMAFAIGSETLGSIVSPSDRCGVTGLRPTYGRVSRTGAMALSWSMDKLGPLCRSVEDCAIVFNAIQGPDGLDQTLYDVPFNYDPNVKLKSLRIGYLKTDFERERGERKTNDEATLAKLRELGADLIELRLPDYPLDAISLVLSTEAAAAFDGLTRDGRDDWLKQQASGSWPNTFRHRRFVPAVEYIQAQRIRSLLIQDTAKLFDRVDLFLAPSFAGKNLLLSNLTGNPCVVLPNGFTAGGTPTSICFIGRLFGEAELLAAARDYQSATDFHRRHPKLE